MLNTIGRAGALLTAALLAAMLSACAAPRPTVQAQERRRMQLERSLAVTQLKLAQAKIAIETGELKYNDQLTHAETEFELAKRRQQIFTKFTAPNRLARAELGLQQAEDGVRGAGEELGQLESATGNTPPVDPAKEAALAQAKRRLEHAQRDLQLRREEFQTLKEITLPLEQRELDLAATQKKHAALQVQRDNEGALLDRQIAVLSADAEATRLEQELADLQKGSGASPASAPAARQP
jgi:hypothetical protein